MTSPRIERRLRKKLTERKFKGALASMSSLQRYVFEGMSANRITREEVIELCKSFISRELLEKLTEIEAIEFLKTQGYTITKKEPHGADDPPDL